MNPAVIVAICSAVGAVAALLRAELAHKKIRRVTRSLDYPPPPPQAADRTSR